MNSYEEKREGKTLKILVAENYWRYVDDLKKLLDVPCEFLLARDDEEALRTIGDVDIVFGARFSRRVLERGKNLKLIQVLGAGVRAELLEAVRGLNVKVANTHGNAPSVAEHALALMFALAKRVVESDRMLREGIWLGTWEHMGVQLEGKVVGIIGLGHVGRELAKRAKALGMRVIAIKRTPDPKIKEELGLEFLGGPQDLEYVLKNADFVVICVPETKETRGMIGERELRMMKPTAFLINVARGRVVDEEALYRALKEGWIAGAGIDVWYRYPRSEGERCHPSKFPFHELPNIVMTPHRAAITPEGYWGMLKQVAENIKRIYRGEEPINMVDIERGY
ncbi:MAG: 2-hydroxyacid dehydrogenase [Candidatus Baldrarchaeia archaeon]